MTYPEDTTIDFKLRKVFLLVTKESQLSFFLYYQCLLRMGRNIKIFQVQRFKLDAKKGYHLAFSSLIYIE